jgi:hypothetical protein
MPLVFVIMKFITGQNEKEETTQNTTFTQSAACASYKKIIAQSHTATVSIPDNATGSHVCTECAFFECLLQAAVTCRLNAEKQTVSNGPAARCAISSRVRDEREETTQNTIVTKSAARAS